MINKQLSLLKKLLFPSPATCELCKRSYTVTPFQVHYLPMLCSTCNDQIHYIHAPICTCCGREMGEEDLICRDCRSRANTFFIHNRSAVSYTPIMRDWIYTYKYNGREHLVVGLVELLYRVYKNYYRIAEIDAITFIPLYIDRLHERRFNQAEQLAVGLAKKTGLPIVPTLTRTRDTLKQSHQNRNERFHSIQGAFQYIEETTIKKSILLVDDIYTTGSTSNEAAKVLRQQGWEQIYTCTIARA